MSPGDVAHQAHAQRQIHQALSGGRMPHAYLFSGPDGVGKEKLALGLAEVLLCPQPGDVSLDAATAKAVGLNVVRSGCGRCEDCRSVAAMSHPDLHLVYRQLSREHPDLEVRKRKALDIGVEVARHFLIECVGRTPVRGLAKLFIVREADRITAQAQNALLKTLEEPPGETVVILLTSSVDRLLPTTLSRCQLVRFDALPADFIHDKLKALLPDHPPVEVQWCARCAEGSLGRAVQIARDGLYNLNQRLYETFSSLCQAVSRRRSATSSGSAMRNDHIAKAWTEAAKGLAGRYRKDDPDMTDTEASRRGLKAIFQLTALWYADLLRSISGPSSTLVNHAFAADIERLSRVISPRRAVRAVNRLAQAEHHLDLNVNAQLCVETLVNDLARINQGREKGWKVES